MRYAGGKGRIGKNIAAMMDKRRQVGACRACTL